MVAKMTWDEAFDKLACEREMIEDHMVPMSAWEPVVENDRFGLRLRETGRVYQPTQWAIKKLAALSNGCREFDWMTEDPVHPTSKDKQTGDNKILYRRNALDAELMRHYAEVMLFQPDRLDQSKKRLFRTWSDGTLRSVLSENYHTVENAWVMQTARELFPESSVIRWRGDADTLQFEVTLDHIQRVDDNSGYGGILHVGNSEIGQRSIIAHLGILRLICTNGLMIMDEIARMHKRHFGELHDLKRMFVETIQKGMPEIESAMDDMMGLKAFGVGDVPLRNIFAQLGIDHKIGRKHIQGIWNAYMQEIEVGGVEETQSAFGLQSAITRFSQTVNREQSFAYDQMAGEFLHLFRNDWDKFLNRARNLTDKVIDRTVGDAILAA